MSTGERIVTVELRDEMRKSFIDYAMSVIVSRAIPDVRDGLKPVHRRIVYGMYELGLTPQSRYRKAAKTVGDVMGNFHPHGDSAIYEALVRLAQPSASRYPLVDGHGNFGDLDNPPAAMRYTEARLTHLAMDLLADIEAETVDFKPNFDDSREEPTVLPSRVPLLLLNGSAGIAVGMATNMPPHNLREVVDGVIAKIDNPELDSAGLMEYIKGPDFPSGGIIMGTDGIRDAYMTGKGSIPVRGVATIDVIPGSGGRQSRTGIIVTSLPYMVGPEAFAKRVAELVKDEKISGVSDINDETDRSGLRVVIELKRDAHPEVVLNQLYKHTQLQQSFPVNTLALTFGQENDVDWKAEDNSQLEIGVLEKSKKAKAKPGKPATMGLQALIDDFIIHRYIVVKKRTRYLLRKAQERAHILEGYLKALENIDEVIKIIRKAQETADARAGLIKRFALSEIQANAILELQLRRLTGLERGKIQAEYDELQVKIADYQAILASRKRVLKILKQELKEIRDKYGDDRRTQIVQDKGDTEISAKDLIPNERMAVFITTKDYIKRTPLDTFKRQRRNTRGVAGVKTKDEDDLQHFFTANTHDKLLVFTNRGQVYSIDVMDIPESSRSARGLAIVNLIPITQDETVTTVMSVSEQDLKQDAYFVMLTLQGHIKKVQFDEFANIRRSGIIAITLTDGDQLGWVRRSNGKCDVILGTSDGMCIRYSEEELRPLGRTARGVRAITLREGDKIVGFDVIAPSSELSILIVTNDGYGKRVEIDEFRQQGRGGMGIIGTKFKKPDSKMACLRIVEPGNEVMIATQSGIIVRQQTDAISSQGRMATGVRLQQLKDDKVVSVTPVVMIEEDPGLNAEDEESSEEK
ncbi:MAG: DNA gyrase subunit A [Candidatus Obscuribacterales bacterium]|nr:DNA gyrase subunit A [Candidatus Obscuribacterales bacterium]